MKNTNLISNTDMEKVFYVEIYPEKIEIQLKVAGTQSICITI